MPLVAAAILPHTPLLAPQVGKEHRKQLQRTVNACERIGQELYALQPTLVVVLTPHGVVVERSFFCNVAEDYHLSLAGFGDLATNMTIRGNPAFAYALKRLSERHHFPITLGTEPNGDYGTTVPASYLSPLWDQASLLPISLSDLSLVEHCHFGKILGSAANASRLRVAIVASVELAHQQKRSAVSPPTSPQAQYDAAVVQAIRHGNFQEIVDLDERLVVAAQTCSHAIFAYLSGLFSGRDQQPSVLSYESPFGIGEVAALFPTL